MVQLRAHLIIRENAPRRPIHPTSHPRQLQGIKITAHFTPF